MLGRLAVIFASAFALGACALDSQVSYGNYIPDFLKQASPRPKVEEPPDVPAILRANANVIFVATSTPTNIRYSPPFPAKHGGWETCVKANVNGATGKPLGERTYVVSIFDNQVGDRQQDDGDRCATVTYQPL